MTVSVGRLVVELIATTAAFQSDLGKAAAVAEQHARRIDSALAGAKNSAIGFGKELLGAFGVVTSVAGVVALFENIKEKAIESEKSIGQLNATLIATGQAAGLTKGDLKDLAEQVKGTSVFSEEDIRKGETALLRFRNIQKGVFEDALKASADLAQIQGQGLESAAQLVGRFVNDPTSSTRALRAIGVQLSQEQVQLATRLIETGHAAEGQRIALEELGRAVGGQALAGTQGLAGATARLFRALSDVETKAGKRIFDVDTFQTAAENAEKLAKTLSEGDESLLGVLLRIAKASGGIVAGLVSGKSFAESFRGSQFQAAEPSRQRAGGQITELGTGLTQEQIDAGAAALRQRIKDSAEKATAEQLEQLKKRAQASASFYALELAEQKAFLDTQQTQLEFGYQQGAVTVTGFFETEKRLARESALDLEKNLQKQIDDQRRLLGALETVGGEPARAERESARVRLRELQTKQALTDIELDKRLLVLDQQEALAVDKLADSYTELAARVAEAQGNAAEATAIRLRSIQHEQERLRLQNSAAAGFPGAAQALANFDALDKQAQAQAKLNDLEKAYGVVLGVVENAQARIDLAVSTGNATEIQGLVARGELALKFAASLTKAADAAEAEARALTGPAQAEALLKVDQMRLKIEQLAAESDLLGKKFRDIFESDFADALLQAEQGAKSFKDVIKDLGKAIETDLLRIANKNLAEQLFGKGGPLGGLSDFFADMFKGSGTIGSLFGGGAGGAATGATLTTAGTTLSTAGVSLSASAIGLDAAAAALSASAAAMSASSIGSSIGAGAFGGSVPFDAIAGYASGGNPPIGRPSLVGERGPELFVPHSAGTIIPNSVLSSRRAARHQTVNITINVPSNTSAASADQIAASMSKALRRASARNL